MSANTSPNHGLGTTFVVTTLSADSSQVIHSKVWDSTNPLGVGFPIRWVIEKTEDGFKVQDLQGELNKVVRNKSSEKKVESSAEGNVVSLEAYRLLIHPVRTFKDLEAENSGWIPKRVSTATVETEEEEKTFKKSLIGALVAFLLFGLVVTLWPVPQAPVEEVIPPQFVKALLTPVMAKGQSSVSGGRQTGNSNNSGNIIMSLRSSSFKKETQKLFDSSKLALLAGSKVLMKSDQVGKVSQLFESQSGDKSAIHSMVKNSGPSDSKLGTMGSGDKSDTNAGGVGYAKGEKAGVGSQGKGFVSVDSREIFVDTGLTMDEVGKVIHSHLSEIRYCYESAMVSDPTLEGKVVYDFVIGGRGTVKTANVKNSTVGNSGLENCIGSYLRRWKFPNPKGGVDVAVSYPFVFKILAN